MQSKNKKPPTAAERVHIARIKEMACIVCEAPGPTECHELEQGLWFASIPLCPDCHRGSINGIHGQRRIWNVKKLDEVKALALTVEKLMNTDW